VLHCRRQLRESCRGKSGFLHLLSWYAVSVAMGWIRYEPAELADRLCPPGKNDT
jgi:hypothetical protein